MFNSSGRCFIMSVDVDGWSSLLKFYLVKHEPAKADHQVNVEEGITKLLRLFEKHRIGATFFVTGEMAQKHFEAIETIARKGHEIACHGLNHEKNECLRSKEAQRETIEKSTQIVEEISGQKVRGFRAPCLRANRTTLEVLQENGYLYDSSFVPTLIPGYYGSVSVGLKPYYPLQTSDCNLLELPVSVNPIVPVPLSGSWMRNLGLPWVKFGIRVNFSLNFPVMFYVHPRDVLSLPLVRGVPWHLYRNTEGNCLSMLDELLKFVRIVGGRVVRAIDLVSN